MKSTIICEKCGKIYDGGVCPKCGTYNRPFEEIKYEKEQKYQNKKDKRDKILEDYGFTNDELFKMYHNEAIEADRVYKAFVTSGFSRIEKVNGRFLASQLIKLEVLSQQNNHIIQQNDEIIELLKEIAENTR